MDKNEAIDVESTTVEEENKPGIEVGNYLIEIVSNDKVIRKLIAANSEIKITRLQEGGLTVDLK